MNREQMAEKAAQAMHQDALESGEEYLTWDSLAAAVRRSYLDSAQAALDVVLPQITTVAELDAVEAESRLTKLVDESGVVYAAWMNSARYALEVGPLTVVWTPEVTA